MYSSCVTNCILSRKNATLLVLVIKIMTLICRIWCIYSTCGFIVLINALYWPVFMWPEVSVQYCATMLPLHNKTWKYSVCPVFPTEKFFICFILFWTCSACRFLQTGEPLHIFTSEWFSLSDTFLRTPSFYFPIAYNCKTLFLFIPFIFTTFCCQIKFFFTMCCIIKFKMTFFKKLKVQFNVFYCVPLWRKYGFETYNPLHSVFIYISLRASDLSELSL